jgi:hypothetical protein
MPRWKSGGKWIVRPKGRFAWKRTSGYYDQAYAKEVFARFKRTFGDRLRAKRDEAQEREASLACQLLNRMLELGQPQSYPVGSKRSPRGQCDARSIHATTPVMTRWCMNACAPVANGIVSLG